MGGFDGAGVSDLGGKSAGMGRERVRMVLEGHISNRYEATASLTRLKCE